MSKKPKLRTLLALVAVPPIVLLGLIAAYGASVTFVGSPTLASLKSDAQTLSLIAIAGVLLSIGMVMVVGRRILDPINEVSDAARELADVRLPKLIESLSTPGSTLPAFERLQVGGQTELAELGEALNSLQTRAVTVANEQQRVVKEGISELVINLARRNQSLLDRQIENIDNLESNEEDPDRLESLFRLDHLATRMRRNAESLLVLAGAEPSRRRGGPVALADVIRVAMSEIEDYQHVKLREIAPAHIGPQGAVDVAHLMSELLENATQFSPPDAPVEVGGRFNSKGFYEIVVADHGIGMSAEQIAAANRTIMNPPELGLALTRSLGFQVMGRLAQRLGVVVDLGQSEGGGTSARVSIPSEVLSTGAAANVPAAFKSAPGGARRAEAPRPRPTPAPADTPAPAQAPPVEAAPAPAPAIRPAPVVPQQPSVLENAPFAPEETLFAPEARPEPIPENRQWPTERESTPPAEAQRPTTEPTPWDEPSPWDEPTPVQAPSPSRDEGISADDFSNLLSGASPEQTPVRPSRPQRDAGRDDSFGQFESEPPAGPADRPDPAHMPQQQTRHEPAPDHWSAPPVPTAASPAPSMEHAIPTGAAFEQGVDALLDDPAHRTDSGLVRRDRSQSQAPVREGREIPGASPSAPVAAPSRSPEEIRNMLSRYREGLKGHPDSAQGPH